LFRGVRTTLAVSWEQMLHHAELAGQAVERAQVIAAVPFPLAQLEPVEVLRRAAQALKLPGAPAVELEGRAKRVPVVQRLVQAASDVASA